MGTFFFYNNRKPRKFNYTHILHDPEEDARKDRLHSRIESIKKRWVYFPNSRRKMYRNGKTLKRNLSRKPVI